MGSEVDLPPGCMFDGASIRSVPCIERGGTFYMGRLNMSNMEKKGGVNRLIKGKKMGDKILQNYMQIC